MFLRLKADVAMDFAAGCYTESERSGRLVGPAERSCRAEDPLRSPQGKVAAFTYRKSKSDNAKCKRCSAKGGRATFKPRANQHGHSFLARSKRDMLCPYRAKANFVNRGGRGSGTRSRGLSSRTTSGGCGRRG